MKEELLHFIWKFKLLKNQQLCTIGREPITVINPGLENNADGPDFLNARVRIGQEEWVGNVEIHVNSSDWLKHNHSSNSKYKNIILHVVYSEDIELEELTFQKIPTVELKGRLPKNVLYHYEHLMSNQKWIPCQDEFSLIDKYVVNSWLDRLLIERIENKTKQIHAIFEKSGFDWNQTFFEVLFRGFGFKKNAAGFGELASRISHSTFQKEKEAGEKNIEALILGTAGFLPDSSNHFHVQKLIKEFEFLKLKYSIMPMEQKFWVKGGVRPANQPFVRVIQLISFLISLDKPLLELLGIGIIKDTVEKLNIIPSGYWKSHSRIGEPKVNGISSMGKKSIDGILINSLLTFQFFYAKWVDDGKLISQTIELFDIIKPEENAIISKWESIGAKANSAGKTQALIELKNSYCSEKKCLFCSIGSQILKK